MFCLAMSVSAKPQHLNRGLSHFGSKRPICNLNSSQGAVYGVIQGTMVGLIKGDTRSSGSGKLRSEDSDGFRVFRFPDVGTLLAYLGPQEPTALQAKTYHYQLRGNSC